MQPNLYIFLVTQTREKTGALKILWNYPVMTLKKVICEYERAGRRNIYMGSTMWETGWTVGETKSRVWGFRLCNEES